MIESIVNPMPRFHFVTMWVSTRLLSSPNPVCTVLNASVETVYASPALDTIRGFLVYPSIVQREHNPSEALGETFISTLSSSNGCSCMSVQGIGE